MKSQETDNHPDSPPTAFALDRRARISGDVFKTSGYFVRAEHHMSRQWSYYIWPRIKGADFSCVVDVACGHGRNTARLAPIARRLIAADINSECLAAVRARFANAGNVETLLVDGASLRGVPDATVTLVYCWDAMVHFEPEVVGSYVADFARVLAPGGLCFVHHSNWTGGRGKDFRTQPHWHNFMSKELFASYVRTAGLEIVSQDVIDWDESYPAWRRGFGLQFRKRPVPQLACISVFRKPA